MGRRSQFPSEFRREAVQLVLSTDKTMLSVAQDLGINEKTLGNWVRAEKAGRTRDARPGALNEHEREELRRLRSENRELKVEREILRKAAAYFAREMGR
jgi:transposase